MVKRTSTKELIAQSLMELGETRPIDKITVQDIADNCDVSKRTFYYHFADKYALIAWIYREEVERVLATADDNWTYYDFQIANIHAFLKNAEYYINAVNNTSGGDSFIKTMCVQTREAFEARFAAQGEDPDERTWFAIDYAIHSAIIAIIDWYRDGMRLSPETLAKWIAEDFPQKAKEALFGPVAPNASKRECLHPDNCSMTH
ncbi:MAG: TetR family transcriptional regulator [Eggerthellaceae bacterium]|nr:TetR family transcriptional regulator [Eggerthellaceae bacterium]